MNLLARVFATIGALLALTVWCTAQAWADEPTTTVTLQVPTRATAGVTTVIIEVRPSATQSTEVRIATDADPGAPIITRAEMGSVDLSAVAVDSDHAFDWKVPDAAGVASCGPHPSADTPGCAARTALPVEIAGEQAAQPPTTAQAPTAAETAAQPSTTSGTPAAPITPETPKTAPAENALPPVMYTVQPGDTLSDIALRLYGERTAYLRIAEANVGRIMPDGRQFQDPQLIRPGWTLLIPQPTHAIEDRDGARYYTVQRGDTLVGIAATLLGDAKRWSEIDSANQELQNANPDLIFAGTQIRVPLQQ